MLFVICFVFRLPAFIVGVICRPWLVLYALLDEDFERKEIPPSILCSELEATLNTLDHLADFLHHRPKGHERHGELQRSSSVKLHTAAAVLNFTLDRLDRLGRRQPVTRRVARRRQCSHDCTCDVVLVGESGLVYARKDLHPKLNAAHVVLACGRR